MSLPIDVAKVSAVLLADGWHQVADGSFTLEGFEFEQGGVSIHSEGYGGLCPVSFRFTTTERDYLAGPLTAVIALRSRP